MCKSRLVSLVVFVLALAATSFAQSLPAPVCQTLTAERARYGPAPVNAELGDILLRTAWMHRADGWGLSGKQGGHNCDSKVGKVACDILQRGTRMWDVLVAADDGGPGTPNCGEAIGDQQDPSARPFVAPVDPGGHTDPPPPGGITPAQLVVALTALRASILADVATSLAELSRRIDELAAHPGGLDAAAVQALIDGAISQIVVAGKTRTAFGHQHLIELGVSRRK